MQQGGFVMWPLLFMSVFTIALSFERLVFWLRVNSSAKLRFGKFMSALHVGSSTRVRDIAAKDNSPYGELADRLAQGDGYADSISVELLEYQRPLIERYILVFSTIVTAAPMLGILGTVLGIIRSFELLGAQETITDPREISAGIAEALLTTAFGLVVALIALVPYMACRGQIERAICRFEAMTAAARGKFSKTTSK